MNGPNTETRRTVLRRDGWKCAICNREIDSHWSGYSIHHRIPRSHPFPGLHEPANLILLCGSGTTGCHGWVHAHPAAAYRMGWLVHNWQTPEHTPLYSHDHGWILLDQHGGYQSAPSQNSNSRKEHE